MRPWLNATGERYRVPNAGALVKTVPLQGTAPSLWTAGDLPLSGLPHCCGPAHSAHPDWLSGCRGWVRGGCDEHCRRRDREQRVWVLGVRATVFVLMALTSSFIIPLKILWLRIAARVVGSWFAASGLLLAGWVVHMSS